MRIVWAVLTVAACSIVVQVSSGGVVHAVDNCGKVIPFDVVDDAVVSIAPEGGSLALMTGPATTVFPGGALVAASAKGAAAVAGTFLSARAGCAALDWITGDGDNMLCDVLGPVCDPVELPPPANQDDVTVARTRCNTLTGYTATAAQWMCFPTTDTSGLMFLDNTYLRGTGDGTFSVGANSFPGVPYIEPVYPQPEVQPYPDDVDDVRWFRPDQESTGFCTLSSGGDCFDLDEAPGLTVYMTYECTGDIGKMCGRHPAEYVVAYSSDPSVRGVFKLYPEAHELGWERRVVTDVLCYDPEDGSGDYWVRAMSDPYFERALDQRIVVPQCGAGYLPGRFVSARVATIEESASFPDGVACGKGNLLSCDFGIPTVQVQLPNLTLGIGSEPDWQICLVSGHECGVPELDGDVCTWGGHALPNAGACDPDEQTNTEPNPETANRTATSTPAPAEYTVGEPVSTAVVEPVGSGDPGDGGGGTTITVPIEEGNGPRGSGYVPLEDEVECWPEGWGWFNPADWVLKPIKCALMWAFVPDGDAIAESWDGLVEEAEQGVPVAWVVNGVEIAVDSVTGLSGEISAHREDCFVWLPAMEWREWEWESQSVCIYDEVNGTWGPWRTASGSAVIGLFMLGMLGVGMRLMGHWSGGDGGGGDTPYQLELFEPHKSW